MHQQPRYPAKPWLTFSVLAAAVMSFTLVQSMTNPVLGTIERHLDTDPNTVSWVLTAYLLSAAILTPIIGRLGDAYGKRRMVLLSLGALASGSLIAALAPSIEVMILARIVQGAGGGVLPLAYSIIRDEFPAESVTGALGNVSSLLAVGVGVGTIIAGPIVTHLGYAWLFWLPMLVSLIAASAASIVIPDSQVRRPGRVPLLPTLLLAAGLVALLLPLSRGPRWGWASPAVIGLITAAVVCLSAWVVAERRAADPLIDMSMMSMRAIWSANLVSILGGVGMYASTAYLPMFIQTPSDLGYGFGASLTRSGLLVAPVAAGSFFVGLVVGRVIRRHGPRRVASLGAWTAGASMFILAFSHESEVHLLVAGALTGSGCSLMFASVANTVIRSVEPDQTGVASGMNANIRMVGGAAGSALMACILATHTPLGGRPAEAGFTHGFAALCIAFALAGLASLLIPSHPASGRHVRPNANRFQPAECTPRPLCTDRSRLAP